MRRALLSDRLLWTLLPKSTGAGTDVGGCVESSLWRIMGSRSFATEVVDGPGDVPSSPDATRNKKEELGRWWQTFSEQRRTQGRNQEKPSRENEVSRWSISKREQSSELGQKDSTTREGGGNRWFIPKVEKQLDQEQPEALNKETIRKWFLHKDEDGSSTELEKQEITSKQVGARWLASAREKYPSDEQELSDPSSSPWFGFSNQTQTPASERERLELSMQRLALMSKLGDNTQTPSFMVLPPKDLLLRKYFHWDNLSSLEKRKITLTKAREEHRIHKTDCGSSQVQIALLTAKIKYMTNHMETHRKDYHSRKGLEAMVQRRKKILKYLRRKDWDAYCDVITKLGLRDNVMEPQKLKTTTKEPKKRKATKA